MGWVKKNFEVIGSIASIIGVILFFYPNSCDKISNINSNVFKGSDNNKVNQISQLEDEREDYYQNSNKFVNSSGNNVDQSINIYKDGVIPIDERFEDSDFDRYLNVGFGFGISYPIIWKSSEAPSLDGITITNPKNENVYIKAWGSYFCNFCSNYCDDDCTCDINDPNIIPENGELIVVKEYLWIREDNGEITTIESSVDAIREENNDGSNKFIMISTINFDRAIAVLCSAPKNDYHKYENIFLKVISSIKIHGEYGMTISDE